MSNSQSCIKRSPLGQKLSGLLRQVTSSKRFNSISYEIFWLDKRKVTVHVLVWLLLDQTSKHSYKQKHFHGILDLFSAFHLKVWSSSEKKVLNDEHRGKHPIKYPYMFIYKLFGPSLKHFQNILLKKKKKKKKEEMHWSEEHFVLW